MTLDEDVLDRARAVSRKLHAPFRRVVNEALRAGLNEVEKPPCCRSYQTRPHKMGLRHKYDLDNIAEVLAVAEGEDYR